MNIKETIIIILATFLALLIGYNLIKHNSKIKPVEHNNSQLIIDKKESSTTETNNIEKNFQQKIDSNIEKTSVKSKDNNIQQSVINTDNIIKEIKITPQKNDIIDLNAEKIDILKDEKSNIIIIDKEYKMLSPAKYSFK